MFDSGDICVFYYARNDVFLNNLLNYILRNIFMISSKHERKLTRKVKTNVI